MAASSVFTQNAGFFRQGQIGLGQLAKICADAAASGNDNNVPSGSKPILIEPVDLPQAAADTIADHSVAQLFTHSHTYPIGIHAVFSGVKHQIPIGVSGGGIKPPENMIQFQCAGKFHNVPLKKRRRGDKCAPRGLPFRIERSKML